MTAAGAAAAAYRQWLLADPPRISQLEDLVRNLTYILPGWLVRRPFLRAPAADLRARRQAALPKPTRSPKCVRRAT